MIFELNPLLFHPFNGRISIVRQVVHKGGFSDVMTAFHRAFVMSLDGVFDALSLLTFVINSVQSAAGYLCRTAEVTQFFENDDFLGSVFKSGDRCGKTGTAATYDGNACIDGKRCGRNSINLFRKSF